MATKDSSPPAPQRKRRTITPARLYREIERVIDAHDSLNREASVGALLDALMAAVLRDALRDA